MDDRGKGGRGVHVGIISKRDPSSHSEQQQQKQQ